jgi:hypothetical protein
VAAGAGPAPRRRRLRHGQLIRSPQRPAPPGAGAAVPAPLSVPLRPCHTAWPEVTGQAHHRPGHVCAARDRAQSSPGARGGP